MRLDVQFIRNETSTFFQNGDEIRRRTNSRVNREAHVVVAAMAGIGIFGSGVHGKWRRMWSLWHFWIMLGQSKRECSQY